MSNPDFGDITDLEEGNDIEVEFIKNPPSGKSFPETEIEVRYKKTPAVDPSNDKLVELLGKQIDIMELFTVPKYEDLKREFEAFVNPEEEGQPAPEETGAVNEGSEPDETSPNNEVQASETSTPAVTEPSVTQKSPSAEKAAGEAVATQDQLKAKFKKMFAEAAAK
jgi:hypothetical protein